MRVLLVHGPNLNRLGSRDPGVYGTVTLDQIIEAAANHGRPLGLELLPFQSNHEGELIDGRQAEAPHADAVVINPGGLAHGHGRRHGHRGEGTRRLPRGARLPGAAPS
jgi:3-dehydroquinate dehydratase-2